MRSADSAGAPEARFAEQGSAQAPARDRRLYARDQMGAAILPRSREAGLGQIPVRQRQPLRFHAPRPVARRQDEGMAAILPPDRKSVVEGKSVAVSLDPGGSGIIQKNKTQKYSATMWKQYH